MTRALAFGSGLLAAACLGEPAAPQVPIGTWGGEHVSLTVTSEGGRLEFDCAHGEMTAPLVADEEGRFTVPGYFVAEHGGPVREGEVEDRRPAVYSGRVDGATLTFRFVVDGASQGPFTVALGRPALLVKCL